jgi:hypothetical protein
MLVNAITIAADSTAERRSETIAEESYRSIWHTRARTYGVGLIFSVTHLKYMLLLGNWTRLNFLL